MNKWHNGPNGPGVCRATKGNCPFGGSEAHYDSRDAAEKVFNKQSEEQYGFLPGMKKEQNSEPNTQGVAITATNSNGTGIAISNFVFTGEGTRADTKYFEGVVKENLHSAKDLVSALSSDKNIYGTWDVGVSNETDILLRHSDNNGNVKFLRIKKPRPKS